MNKGRRSEGSGKGNSDRGLCFGRGRKNEVLVRLEGRRGIDAFCRGNRERIGFGTNSTALKECWEEE